MIETNCNPYDRGERKERSVSLLICFVLCVVEELQDMTLSELVCVVGILYSYTNYVIYNLLVHTS